MSKFGAAAGIILRINTVEHTPSTNAARRPKNIVVIRCTAINRYTNSAAKFTTDHAVHSHSPITRTPAASRSERTRSAWLNRQMPWITAQSSRIERGIDSSRTSSSATNPHIESAVKRRIHVSVPLLSSLSTFLRSIRHKISRQETPGLMAARNGAFPFLLFEVQDRLGV